MLAVKTFMNNASYLPRASAATTEGGCGRLQSENRCFLAEHSHDRIIEAGFEGEDAMKKIRGTLVYSRTREGIWSFLQDPGFDYLFTRFFYSDGYYELGAPGLQFRVNVTAGNVASAEFLGPEAMEVMEHIATYHRITGEMEQITMQESS